MPLDGVHRLELPTPFRVGPVSCWLLDGDPLTLVDPGPRSPDARAALESALAAHGRHVEDVEQVVLTHQHHDHVGLAAEIRDRSGARVAATPTLARYLADYERGMDRNDAYAAALMVRHGIDAATAATLDGVSRSFRHFSGGSPVDTLLEPGGEVAAGARGWRIFERPGHSPTDTVLHDERDGLLVGGDHLLERTSSSPVGHAPIDDRDPRAVAAGDGRPRPLVDLVSSLRATMEMDVATVLPGHGEAFEGHRDVADRRIAMHGRRARRILRRRRRSPHGARDRRRAVARPAGHPRLRRPLRGARPPRPARSRRARPRDRARRARRVGAGRRQGCSSSSVTGPSLTSSTSMCAPNTPRCGPEALAEALVERLGELGARRADEARPVALARVAVERELADAQDLAVAERLVHAPVGVLEDAQRPDLVGQAVGARLRVVVGHAEQHEQPGTDAPGAAPVDAHLGAADALHQRPHVTAAATIATTTTIAVPQAIAWAISLASSP